MPVDYSKFKDIEDSDEEPIWETKAGKQYWGLAPKALTTLDAASEKLKSRKCYCFLDFASDPDKLQHFAQDILQNGGSLPSDRALGRVIVELNQAAYAPKLCENFRSLCTGERGVGVGGHRLHYKGLALDLILPRFCVQGAIRNEYSCWGSYLPDEQLRIPSVCFDRPGVLAVGNHGANTNSCTFMITLHAAEHLDGCNQIIGRVVKGMEVLRLIEMFPTDRKERSFAEKDVKTWWGGTPTVDVLVSDCGELSEAEAVAALMAPADGDVFPEHPLDWSVHYDHTELFDAQAKLRDIGNQHFKQKHYTEALAKYKKAQAYLEPLLRRQHLNEFGDQDVTTWMAGGVRPKDRTDIVRAALTVKLNVCQVMLAMREWQAAIAVADGVLLELVGKHSKKGHGTLPNDPLTVKAFFRRARARVGLSEVPGQVPQLEEAIEDLRQALAVEPAHVEVKAELDRVLEKQRRADEVNKAVYQSMVQGREKEQDR